MKPSLHVSCGLVCWILGSGAVPSAPPRPFGPTAAAKDGQSQPESKERKRLTKMIDALANRNAPPKLVDYAEGAPVALFPAKFDWKENDRVRSALGKVRAERTPDMWEELIQRMNDRRYCLTLKDKNETFALGNWTVGDFCALLAGDWLDGVCNQHLPNDPIKDGYQIIVDIGMTGGLVKWRKQRANKKFYELQIEVCEETIRQLAKVARVPQRDKDRAHQKIEAEIAKLKSTKRAIFTAFTTHYAPAYTAKDADEARKLLRDKK
jgi:hypothetical protein